jgi:hypothetical protein
MSIVISPLVRLVITDADVTNFNYGANQATEIAILRDISVDRKMTALNAAAERVSTTSNRVTTSVNTGYGAVKFEFSSYLKPITDVGNVVSAEKLLWESLSATDTTDTASTSTVAFTSGNTNKLRELYFYLIFEDGTYYKIKQGVVSSVQIDMDISRIAKATWEVLALDMEYVSTSNLTGTPKDLTNAIYIRNRLSTVAMNIAGTNYVVAITKGSFSIKNNVKMISRTKVGEILIPTGHYTGDRTTNLDLSFYLNTQTDGSSTLLTDLLTYTTLTGINTLTNTTLSIGGSSSALKIDVPMPTAKIKLKNPTVGLYNTVDVSIMPQESTKGSADELTLVYNN